jgi:hypothetical protein
LTRIEQLEEVQLPTAAVALGGDATGALSISVIADVVRLAVDTFFGLCAGLRTNELSVMAALSEPCDEQYADTGMEPSVAEDFAVHDPPSLWQQPVLAIPEPA